MQYIDCRNIEVFPVMSAVPLIAAARGVHTGVAPELIMAGAG